MGAHDPVHAMGRDTRDEPANLAAPTGQCRVLAHLLLRRRCWYVHGDRRLGIAHSPNLPSDCLAGAADLAIRAVANLSLLQVSVAFDPDVPAMARAVDFQGSLCLLRQAEPSFLIGFL